MEIIGEIKKLNKIISEKDNEIKKLKNKLHDSELILEKVNNYIKILEGEKRQL